MGFINDEGTIKKVHTEVTKEYDTIDAKRVLDNLKNEKEHLIDKITSYNKKILEINADIADLEPIITTLVAAEKAAATEK